MALQITDLVSPKALADLKKLNDELIISEQVFAKVAKNLAINVNVKVEGKEDLANLTKVITTNFNQLNAATERAKEAQKKFSDEVGKEVKTIKEAQQYSKDLRKVRNEINTTTEEGRRKLKEYNDQIDKNTKYIKENSDAYTKQKMGIGGYFQSIMQGLTVFELLKKGVDFMRESIKKALETIKEFEAANARLSAITGESARGMRELEGQARQLGKTTRYTATEITQLQTELAKLGFAKDDILAMTDSVYKFGLATGGSMADSAALAGAMLRTFGAQADETKRYVSALTAATTKSALSFGYLQVALPIVSGGAAMMGWSIEDVTALLGKLADSGMSASIAATALRNIFLKLSDTNSEMYAKFGKIDSFEVFIEKLKELQESGIDLGDALELADKRSVIPFANLIKHADEATQLRDAITGVGDELDNMANKINDTVEGSTYSLKSAWEALGLAFYNSKGWIKDCIDMLTWLVRTAATAMTSLNEIRAQYYSEFSMKEEDEWTNPEQRVVNGADGKVTTEVTTKRQDAIRLAQARYNDLVKQGVDKEKARGQAIAENTKDLYEQINTAVKLKEKFGELYAQEMAYEASIPAWRLDRLLGSQSRMRGYGEANAQGQAEQQAKIDSIQKTIDAINNWDFEPKKTPDKPNTDTKEKVKKEKQETAKTQEEITAIVLAYQRDRIKAQLATTEQGSEEELCLKQDLLATEYAITLNNNKKIKDSTIADIEQSAKLGKITEEEKIKYIEQINNDYIQRNEEAKTKMREDDAVLEVESYARMFAMRRQMLDEQFAEESARNVEELNQRLTDTTLNEKDRLQVIKDYKVKQKQLETDYNEEVRSMTQESIQEQIDLLDELLGMEAVDTELRAKLEKELADLKAKYAKASADEQIKQAERTAKNEEEKAAARRKLLEDYLNQAQDTFSAISNFANRLYENQLDDIDEEKNALDEKYDNDIERIERLEDQGAISSEEAEARKRAAKDQTEQKEEELNKKKQEIAYKQAMWEKATSASQTTIATALGIMQVWAAKDATLMQKTIMAALVAAQGAMQLATIIATPIPKYAKGTEGHKGGLAVVGDGGRSEFVMIGNQGWVTPSTSTLVDLPKGAQVFPDAKSVMMTLPVYNENGKQVKVVNDYKELERKQKTANGLLKVIAANTSGNSNYNQYKQTIW